MVSPLRRKAEKKKGRKKEGRKKVEPVSLSKLNKLTPHPMQTWEMGFSLEMNRLGDNDADDCFLFLTFHVVMATLLRLPPADTHLKKSTFFQATAVNVCASPENYTNHFPTRMCARWKRFVEVCCSQRTMRKLWNVLFSMVRLS